jgi:hypothetical protein
VLTGKIPSVVDGKFTNYLPIIINYNYNLITGTCSTFGDSNGAYMFLRGGKLRERDHLEEVGLHVRIILKWIFRKWERGAWTGLIWLRIRTSWWVP